MLKGWFARERVKDWIKKLWLRKRVNRLLRSDRELTLKEIRTLHKLKEVTLKGKRKKGRGRGHGSSHGL